MASAPSVSSLAQVILRCELWYDPDAASTILPEDDDIVGRRAQSKAWSQPRQEHSAFGLRILLDHEKMLNKSIDTAILREELDARFPGQFEILRSVADRSSKTPRLRLRPSRPVPRYRCTGESAFGSDFVTALRRILQSSAAKKSSVRKSTEVKRSIGKQELCSKYDYKSFCLDLQDVVWGAGNDKTITPGIVCTDDSLTLAQACRLFYDPSTKRMTIGRYCRLCETVFLRDEWSRTRAYKRYCAACVAVFVPVFSSSPCSKTLVRLTTPVYVSGHLDKNRGWKEQVCERDRSAADLDAMVESFRRLSASK